MKKKTKRIVLIIIVLIILVLVIYLFPKKCYLLDGGSICYSSLIYDIYDYNSLDGLRGISVYIFDKRIYDGTYFVEPTFKQW